jgi:D-beta-D-heptose 7-phosphate kinase/D-beta-D-heptose 1-phosphate adenosyltransferase
MSSITSPAEKVLSREELLALFGRPRDFRLVFTNGCFDILHRGHVEYLHEARTFGDVLVVGMNTDSSVRALKGPHRPVVPEEDRAMVLAGLASVDAVTLFAEATPRALIGALLPDVLVKGGDYTLEQIVGREEVQAAGGEVKVLPFIQGRSTTELLQSIRGTAE